MIGLTLGNRYCIEEKVGIGGMAVVYKAKDTLLNRYVAVKVLKNEFMDDDEFLKKFAMEAQSAASLSHPNIVSVYDVGSSSIDGKRYNYIVMELIEGKTLKDVINEKGALEPEFVVNIGVQIASAIEAAHKNGVIHRDIKPHNILINNENVAKVTDFGIARISSSATITYTSTVLGTVHYISPEQAKGKFIDEKSDIYSLGVVLYEMATGKVPFDAENAVGIALKHIQDPLIEPKSINGEIPNGLNDIIIKALSKEPVDRFSNATEFKLALLNYRNYKLDDNDEFGKTERIGVIKDEDATKKTDTKAIYNMPKDEVEDLKEKDKKVKKKKNKFKTYFLPIILALLLVGLVGGAIKVFGGGLFKKDIIETPNLIELTEDEAIEKLEKDGNDLKFEIVGKKSSEVEKGKIFEQKPKAGTDIKKGETIKVYVSSGEKNKDLEDLSGMTSSKAKKKLEDLGLKIVIEEEYNNEVPKGVVIRHNPGPGEKIKSGSTVTLFVSKGKEVEQEKNTTTMVDVIGRDRERAIGILEGRGLRVTVTEEYDENIPAGIVISQGVGEGVTVEKGQTVQLTVSKGKKEENTNDNSNNNVEPPTQGNTKSYNFEIPVKDINPGNYTVRIEEINDLGEQTEIYNGQFDTSDGNRSIPLKVESGKKYSIIINGSHFTTVTP